jgi:nucleotide-binding universal stress UspA family protein
MTSKCILVPVDLSERNADAIRVAAELARDQDASLTLLHVVETIDAAPDLEPFYAELTDKAQSKLEGWATGLEPQGLRVDVRIIRGNRAREIVSYAEDQNSALIVIATHRVDSSHPRGALGTISQQVALMANCSVMLVR